MGPSLFAESLGNAVEKSGQEAYFASCDFCFVHFLNQEQVNFFFNKMVVVFIYCSRHCKNEFTSDLFTN